MKKKIVLLVFGIFILQFITSCCRDSKYYDYSEMVYELSGNTIQEDEDLTIRLEAFEVEYLASNLSEFGFSNATALSCDLGWGGMKYPLQNIEITSTSRFNDAFGPNEDLKTLFTMKKFIRGTNNDSEFVPIKDINFAENPNRWFEFLLTERPTNEQNHNFTIKLTKTNEEIVTVVIEEITWE